MQDVIEWFEHLNSMAEEIKRVSKCQHEPYDNFGGTNMELIEIAVSKELERLLKEYEPDSRLLTDDDCSTCEYHECFDCPKINPISD